MKLHQAMNLQITTAPYIEESSIVMSDNHYNTSYPNPYAVVYLNDSRGIILIYLLFLCILFRFIEIITTIHILFML